MYANTLRTLLRLNTYVKRYIIIPMKDTKLSTLGEAFKAFADPTRLRILGLLAGGEICVCNIHECLGISQPTASRHLAYLRRKNIVETRREGCGDTTNWRRGRARHAGAMRP